VLCKERRTIPVATAVQRLSHVLPEIERAAIDAAARVIFE